MSFALITPTRGDRPMFEKQYWNRAFKKYSNLTDKELGKKLGVSRQTVQNCKEKFTSKRQATKKTPKM